MFRKFGFQSIYFCRSILKHEQEQLTLLRFPNDDLINNPITIIEAGSSTGVCPKDLCKFIIFLNLFLNEKN